jgi:hypothetical protein
VDEVLEEVGKAFDKTFKEMSDILEIRTVNGKGGWQDVTQDDWEASQFEVKEIKQMVLSKLNQTHSVKGE